MWRGPHGGSPLGFRTAAGIDGLTWKTGDYTPEFRLKVVRAVINDKLSLRDATAQFNLPNESTVYQWVKRFQASGAGALSGLKRGRPKKPAPEFRCRLLIYHQKSIPLLIFSINYANSL